MARSARHAEQLHTTHSCITVAFRLLIVGAGVHMGKRLGLLSTGVFASLAAGVAFSSADVAIGTIPGNFNVTLSGSSNYSIPIKIAPGAAGTQPQIQLVYDSQTIGGAIGAGWSLAGLSAITRGPHDQFVDGAPGPVLLSETDALYFDGQRIVPVGGPTGAGPQREIEYRKVNDDHTKIIQIGADLNHSYFLAKTKGGVTLVLGNPENVTAGAVSGALDATIKFHDGTVIAFAESVVIDTSGNYISFHYEANTYGDNNVTEIDYTGHGTVDAAGHISTDRAPFASVSFYYDELKTRPLEYYVGGQLLRKDRRLTDIYSCVSSDALASPFNCADALKANKAVQQAAHYVLEYTDTNTANRFTLNRVHLFG
jgi:hypothetical protein